MEFLRVVEEELRALAAEARRRHPVVQEAAERAILKLRNMREEYAVALRQQHEGEAPPLSMFRSQDLLRPFLLACNHADASPHLMIMAMGSIQYLINRDAILPSDAPNILRVLAIQSQSKDADVQKRVLQTMVMVVTWKSCDMTEDTVAQALGVCLGLHDAKNAMVRTAADMTVRQIISLLFDRVAEELGVTPSQTSSHFPTGKVGALEGEEEEEAAEEEEEKGAGGGRGALRCAHLVFQDLCVLARGEQGQWIKRTSVSATLGLELVEQVLSLQPVLFRRFKVLRRLLSQEVCPLILQTMRRRMKFPLLVRLLRAASTLVVNYGDLLPNESRSILSTMLASLGTGLGCETAGERQGDGSINFSPSDGDGSRGCVSWAAMLTLEAIHRVLSNRFLVFELFRHEEEGNQHKTLVEAMLHGVSQHLVRNLSSQQDTQGLEAMALSMRTQKSGRGGSASSSSGSGEGQRLPVPPSLARALERTEDVPEGGMRYPTKGGVSGAGSGGASGGGPGGGTRSSSSDLLHEAEEPSLDDAELLLWALQCVVDFPAALSSLVDDEFGNFETGVVLPSSVALAPGEVPPKGSRRGELRRMCERLWAPVLSSLSHVMAHCSDPLVVATVVDGYKSFAVVSGVLGVENALDGFMSGLCRFGLPQWHGADAMAGGGGGGAGQGGSAAALGWNHVGALEGMLLVVHRLGNLLRGSWHVVLDTLEQAAILLVRRAIARPRWSPQSPDTELAEVERHCIQVLHAAERLVQYSTCLEDDALYTLMSSLQALAAVDLANMATVLPQERATAREAAQMQPNGHAGGGAGAAAVAAASGLVSFVGAAARGVGAAMSEGRDAISRDPRINAKLPASSRGGGGGGEGMKTHSPWVSSRLVVECAAANTWRLPVVWELVSGHLRVVAKAREPATRDYAVRALRELIVDGVQRLHPLPPPPPLTASHSSSDGTKTASSSRTPAPSAPPAPGATLPLPSPPSLSVSHSRSNSAPVSGGGGAPSRNGNSLAATAGRSGGIASGSGGGGSGGGEDSFIPSFMRARSEGGDAEDEPFRWVFDAYYTSGVFVAVGRAARRVEGEEEGGAGREENEMAAAGIGGEFEGVLFETMGLFALTPHVDTREATLQTLYTILQSCGQVLDSAWAVILNLLHSVAVGATDTPSPPQGTLDSIESDENGLSRGNSAAEYDNEDAFGNGQGQMRPATWGGTCLSLAFKCLQIIVDDFLERVPSEQVPELVTCTGAFGGQTESVNLSLTAIGMLWTVCDTFADTTAAPKAVEHPGKKTPPSSPLGPGRPSLRSMWPTMLFELRSLAVDFRPELRNCAVNTLFSVAVGNGSVLSESEWKQFLLEVTFPLIEQVLESTSSASSGANTAVAPELKKGVRMLMHHTRDTDQKQWNETRVHAMQGLGRVLRAYVGGLSRYTWFAEEGGVWTKSLKVYRDACLVGSDSQEVSLAGVDGITTMVLLVGRMGLKSVQVRAGVGMKVVDGTLQRKQSLAKVPAKAPISAGKKNTGPPGSISSATAAAAAAGAAGGGDAARMTPEFVRMRPALYLAAWAAMVEASAFEVDASGDVAPAFVQGIATVYKAGMEEGAEWHPGQDGEEQRMHDLFEVLEGLFLPRVPPPDRDPAAPGAPPRRPVYLPKVSPGQRAILDFLQEDLRSGWQLALRLLAKYSVAGWGGGGDGGGVIPGNAGGIIMGGAQAGFGVTPECVKEVAEALSSMMSTGRVPKRDRALALEALLLEVSGPCVRLLERFRAACQAGKGGSPADLTATATATPTSRPLPATATPTRGDVETPIEFTASSWPSQDSYTQVMRLLLALLADGLPCLSDKDTVDDTFTAESREDNLVQVFKVAVKAIGSIAECRRLSMVVQGGVALTAKGLGAGVGAGRGVRGGGSGAGGSEAVGFSELLREALSLVTGAAWSDLVPLVQKGSCDATDATRALIDTLGAVACSVGDALPSTGGSFRENSGTMLAEGGDSSYRGPVRGSAMGSEAFGLAVDELGRMCAVGKGDGVDWELLGLPLRRRACWHLLRCVWSTARRLRAMEETNALGAPGTADSEDNDNEGETGYAEGVLALTSHRCAGALAAAGKGRLPPGLLTSRFKKLAATKQAQEEERYRSPAATSASASSSATATATAPSSSPSPPPSGEGGGGGGIDPDDVEWASMAEEEGVVDGAVGDPAGSDGDGDGDEDGGGRAGVDLAKVEGREHLILLSRALLMCLTSRAGRVREAAAELLAEADIPGALDALQDEVAALKRQLRQRETQVRRRDGEVRDLRAQVAAGAFI